MESNKPSYEKRLGHIRLAIWENITEKSAEAKTVDNKSFGNGGARIWHNVSITRTYVSDGQYKEASTYNGLGDLALVAECVQLARAWILARQDNA